MDRKPFTSRVILNYIALRKVFPAMLRITKIKIGITAAFFTVMAVIMVVTGMAPSDLDPRLDEIVAPYRFSITDWEIEALSYELEEILFGGSDVTAEDSLIVLEYFTLRRQVSDLEWRIELVLNDIESGDLNELEKQLQELQAQKEILNQKAEKVLEMQIQQTMAQLDIYNPLDSLFNLDATFPPVSFKLEAPPHLLVISNRDSIQRIEEVKLSQYITIEERMAIEEAVDELGVSSLVIGIGGIATYPSFVIDTAGLQRTIDIVVEEWLHQYLVFRPLGFYYALHIAGISVDYEIAVMNETAVGIASEEIGAVLYQNYYAPYIEEAEESNQNTAEQGEEPVFDFYKEMREIRLAVDEYLANGEVEQAEEFMEQKRLFLLSNGYYIRKLNQAYFSFYGTYASSQTSVNPIGDEIRALRQQAVSIDQFLNTMAAMVSRDDLIESIN
ncbi:hypothetical protein ACFLYS_02605 [Chloroflexota bacterium]